MLFSSSPQHLGNYKAAKINTENGRFERACVHRKHFGLRMWFRALAVPNGLSSNMSAEVKACFLVFRWATDLEQESILTWDNIHNFVLPCRYQAWFIERRGGGRNRRKENRLERWLMGFQPLHYPSWVVCVHQHGGNHVLPFHDCRSGRCDPDNVFSLPLFMLVSSDPGS